MTTANSGGGRDCVPATEPLVPIARLCRSFGVLALALTAAWPSMLPAQTPTPVASAPAAGNGAVSGRVRNAVTGDALAHAQIVVQGTSIVTGTDEGGHYYIGNLPTGPVTLNVSFSGLDTQSITANVAPGRVTDLDVDLTSSSLYGTSRTVKLDQFVVQSTRETNAAAIAVNEQRYAPNIKSVVAADEFGPQVDQNPGELLKYLPGMDVEYFANNIVGVSVRGLGSNNTEITFDGMPVASMNAEGVGRGMDVQYQSVADVSRAEIVYVRRPEDSSNTIGGSVNFVRKSAFEANRRRISYRFLFQGDGEKLASKIDGPKDRILDRWRPNWQMSWTEPINHNLGFAVTLGQNNTIVNTHWSLPGWNLGSSSNNSAAAAALAAGNPLPTVPSIFNPGMRNPLNHNAPLMQGKDYASIRADWRPIPELTLGWSISGTRGWKQVADDIRYRWDAAATGSGNANRYNDATTALGRVGGGAIYHDNPLWRDVNSPTVSTAFDSVWRKGDWEASLNGSWSQSRYSYFDTEHGFFNSTSVSNVTGLTNIPNTGVGSGTANPIPLTVDYRDIDYWGPKTIQAFTTATGKSSTNIADYTVPVDWASNGATRIGGARSRPGKSEEIVTAGRAYLQRYFRTVNPFTAKLGLDWYDTFRNRHYDSYAWQFVGADGIPNSPDDSSTLIGAVNLHGRRDSEYDYPGSERISMTRLYKLYQDHPDWFRYDEARSARLTQTQNPAYDLHETTTAPYLAVDTRLFHNRLRLQGGVRYEKTKATTHGLLTNQSNAYLKYANGVVVHAGDATDPGTDGKFGTSDDVLAVRNLGSSTSVNYQLVNSPSVIPTYIGHGSPVYVPAVQQAGNAARAAGQTTDTNTNLGRGTLAETLLVYQSKGATGRGTNDGYYPSLNADYNITDNLILQFGYARTQAKLDYNSVLIPGTSIDDNPVTSGQGAGALGRVTLHNTDLRPWTGNNFDARLAYYTSTGGQFNLAVFTKRVKDIIVQEDTAPLTLQDIDALNAEFPNLNLGPELEGYTLRTSFNEGNGRLDGAEFAINQRLDHWVPSWARGFTVVGSATYLNRKGPNSNDLGTNRAWLGKLNLMYSRPKLFLRLGYTYNGEQINNPDISSNGYHGRQVTVAQNLVDVSASYAITKWAKLFIEGKDITDERRAREDQYDVRPSYSYMGSSNTFGVTYTIGVTGSF
jgi:iron complex outermembrane recepter protein